MLITYCPNSTCPRFQVAKSVPDDLATAVVHCGACGTVCTPPVQRDQEPGEPVTTDARTVPIKPNPPRRTNQ